MKNHQSEVLPPFSSNWTRRVVRLSTWPQLTSNGRWATNDGRRATTVDISTAATMLSSFHQRPCRRSSTFLASIFFTIFTARAFWRLRSFLFSSFFFSFHYFSPVLPSTLLIVQTWHYCFLRLTRQEENTTSTAAKPGQNTEKGSLLSQQFALALIVALSLSLSLYPLLTSRRCAIVCEYAKLKLAATGTL